MRVTFLLSLLFIWLSPANAKTTLITNVKGYSHSQEGDLVTFTQLAFESGRVVRIGNNLNTQFPKARIIDGKGKTMLPGLIDGHAHFLGLGINLSRVDVRDLNSAQKTAQKVAKYSKQNPQLDWVLGRGWNQVLWPNKRFPTAKDLDEYVSNKPVVLSRVDGHAVWLNSAAMKLAGINRHSIAPEGGEIIKDSSGNPTGVLIDNAESLVWEKVPKQSRSQLELAFNKVNQHLLSLGITSVHDAGLSSSQYEFLKQKAEEGEFSVRVYGMLSAADKNLLPMLRAGYFNDKNDMFTVRSVKIYGDGALGSRGAALLLPYQDDPQNKGLLVTQPDKLRQLYQAIFSHQFQINIHAIGDRANRIALDEFAFAYQQFPKARKLRNRIEHAQVVDITDIPRFKALDVLPSMQPTHATSDMNMAGDRIGDQRLKGAYAWQSFLKQGSKVIAGSDFPVELANPFFGLHAAVTRQNRKDQPAQGWLKHEALTLPQALKAFTLDAAFGAHQEDVLGTLEAGKWADFILVDQDVFSVPPENIWKTKVLETWVAGVKRYAQ